MQEITDIVQIKHEVLCATARHAFQGDLHEAYDKIPYEIIKGIKPNFRCCVYREREIIRQRVRMAMGKLPMDVLYTDSDPSQVVHVIPCACEGCPITKITVTQNCQSCLAKKCAKACPFGAITTTPRGAVIDQEKCRKCGKCVAACPYNAIVEIERPCKKSCPVKAINMDENDIATIDPAKCVNCGACVAGCPFGAISDVSMMTNVIEALKDGKKEVVALIAPAIEGQFGSDTIPQIKEAIRQLGFADVYEVALGADIVATAVAALERYPMPCLLVNFDTAITVMGLDAQRSLIGGCISPGVRLSLEALYTHAAQLPQIDLTRRPGSVAGASTVASMEAGLILGTASMVDGLIDRFAELFGCPPAVVATGELCRSITSHCVHRIQVDEDLLTDGLALIYLRNCRAVS